jgi:hypothetical protein
MKANPTPSRITLNYFREFHFLPTQLTLSFPLYTMDENLKKITSTNNHKLAGLDSVTVHHKDLILSNSEPAAKNS